MARKPNFDAMSVDELWVLHEELGQVLSDRLTVEKRELEKRLAQLRNEKEMRPPSGIDLPSIIAQQTPRRKYPHVLPKYRNPDEPAETWSGRGKTPRWLAAALQTGHKIEDFAIGSNKSRGAKTRA